MACGFPVYKTENRRPLLFFVANFDIIPVGLTCYNHGYSRDLQTVFPNGRNP